MGEVVERCRKVAGVDVALADDGELVAVVGELAAAQAALGAAQAHVVAEVERRGVCDREMGLTTVDWLVASGWSRRAARACVRTGDALGRMAPVDDAFGRGDLSGELVAVLVGAVANPRAGDQVVGLAGELVELAGRMPFEVWRRQVGELVELLDQDGGYDPARDLERNRLHLDTGAPGVVGVRGELVGEAALVATEAVEAKADRLWRRFHADHLECPELAVPSRATLRALALVDLIRDGLAAGGAGPAPVAELTVVVHVDDPAGVSASHVEAGPAAPSVDLGAERDVVRSAEGRRVDPASCGHLWCDPALHLVWVDRRGLPLRAGRRARLATSAQRRALWVRDGGCTFRGCDMAAHRCDAHHVIAYEDGGETVIENLALLCRHHHGVTHRAGWTMTATADQRFTWTTPTGRTIASQRHRRPDP